MWMQSQVTAIVMQALAATLAPAEQIAPSDWAARNIVLPDGPYAGQLWDPQLTPHLVEILDQLGPDSTANTVTLRKSAQLGATTIGLAWAGYCATIDPSLMMVVMPTLDAADGYNREKLSITFEGSPAIAARVAGVGSRSAKQSTARTKRYRGGNLILTGANSSADLRSKTRNKLIADEIDEWPLDLNGQGDPMEMAEARLLAYEQTGDWKILHTSTPTFTSVSRINAKFEDGDQRYWMVPCPHCGEKQRLVFGDGSSNFGLKFEKTVPHNAHYVCAKNGCVISHSEKPAMIRAGEWVATVPGVGRQPSYHLDTLSSLLVGWDAIAAKFLAAGKDPTKLKAFTNLWLGLPWDEKGDAPDWQRLYTRRADYTMGIIPQGGLILTAAVDVQGDGLFYEVTAWGRGATSWVVEAGFITGDTAVHTDQCWTQLGGIYHKVWPMAAGGAIQIDLMGVDSGFNTTSVYHFVRGKPKALALKGVPGWTAPALGTPAKQDINNAGKKKRRAVKIWPVGTWPLKAWMYGMLRLEGIAEGEAENPPGYCHFGTFLDQRFFQQLTAEYIADREVKGKKVREWVAKGENHYHDCRVYNSALAWHLGIHRLTDDEWANLASDRETPVDQPELLAIMNNAPKAPAVPKTSLPTGNTTTPAADAEKGPPPPPPRRSQPPNTGTAPIFRL